MMIHTYIRRRTVTQIITRGKCRLLCGSTRCSSCTKYPAHFRP